ncbi:MAG: glycosyl hydrolase family 65 protein [Candidatus Omnitrophota bacterium]
MKDFYAKYTNEDLWCIREEGFHKSLQAIRESQLSLGNGYMGVRAVLEEIPPGAVPGTYLAGIYDRITSQVAELVNLPNLFNFKFTVNGEKLDILAMNVLEHKRILNMRDGLLTRHTVYVDSKKRRYDYQSIRFVSMADKNIGVMQIVLTPLDDAAEIELHTGIDTSVVNAGTVTEGQKKHFRVKEIGQEDNSGFLVAQTFEKKHLILFRSGFTYRRGGQKVYAPDNILELKLKKRQSITFTKVFYISVLDNDPAELKKNKNLSKKHFQKVFKSGFQSLLKKHSEAWHALWDVADVVIEGTASIQKNLRFNIYHMLICARVDEGFSSIGARTLSGEGYRGHIFWDAEIFMVPFYAYVCPQVAKNMLLYRYQRLEQARAIAKKRGYKGAMFPWESAGTGEEETPTWARNLDGTIIQIKTNKQEQHITADIAFACNQYFTITSDIDFMSRYGCEIIFETARFWASRLERNKKNQYEIKDVIGPDEFHEHVSNNAFTNWMARWNLLIANKLYFEFKKFNPKEFVRLTKDINLVPAEINRFKTMAQKIHLNIREDKVIEQFDGFFKKRYIEIVNFDENFIPLLPDGIKVKDYNKTQFVKQADVLMLLYLFGDEFNDKTKESNFFYYANRTLHKSSLSPAIHALMAIEAGALSRAYQFFNVALRADISNLHGNTHEGIHAASLGGTWQVVVNGFAGVRVRHNMLSVDPRMPHAWRRITCSFVWRNSLFHVDARNNKVRIKMVSKGKRKEKIDIFGKNRILKANKEFTFTREKPLKTRQDYYL